MGRARTMVAGRARGAGREVIEARRAGTNGKDGTVDYVIEAVGLTKRYQLGRDNFVDALRGASVRIAAGEMVAIMGPSGSGKSTMMHIVSCLDAPDEGEVRLAGRRVDNLTGKALNRLRRTEVGFVFQGFNLIPSLTALDNVALAAEYAGASRRAALTAAREVLDLVGLSDRMRHLPSELSGGQQQRVAIARALVNKPVVLFGDEPTGNLDSVSSAEVMGLMRAINERTGTTFVLVTHDEDVAGRCDRVVRMRDGVVIGQDAPGLEGAEEWAA